MSMMTAGFDEEAARLDALAKEALRVAQEAPKAPRGSPSVFFQAGGAGAPGLA